jgi:hypothetical protein
MRWHTFLQPDLPVSHACHPETACDNLRPFQGELRTILGICIRSHSRAHEAAYLQNQTDLCSPVTIHSAQPPSFLVAFQISAPSCLGRQRLSNGCYRHVHMVKQYCGGSREPLFTNFVVGRTGLCCVRSAHTPRTAGTPDRPPHYVS